MISPRLTQLSRQVELFAAKGVGYHQTYARWRLRRLLSQWQRKGLLPSAQQLGSKLALNKPELAAVCAPYAQGRVAEAAVALQSYFRNRATPRFFLMPAHAAEVVALVDQLDSAGKARTLEVAGQICNGIFSFRNAPPVHFTETIDWQHTPEGNTDWRWDLNRHAYFEDLGRAYWYTGDERYAECFGALLHDWLANNPAEVTHPNWSSVFEVAFRINTWLWAFHLFQHALSLDAETLTLLLAGLWQHGHFLDTHLELHAQNNHLLLEAKSLAMLGLLLPEFKDAARWCKRGLSLFTRELRDQVCADGVHGERASLYHRIISGELLELLVLATNNHVVLPPEIGATLGRMAEFELWLTKPNGEVALVGDSALEDVHLRFNGASGGAAFLQRYDLKSIAPALGEQEIWLLGAECVQRYLDAPALPLEVRSRAFAEGGYFVQRSGSGPESLYALFDCGPFGYSRDATHGHADALNLELYAHGQSWLVDPGVYSTHLGWEWRRFFRGTAAHNTVVVDGQDQSELLDGRRVYHPAQSTLHKWVANETFDYVAGYHNGYMRLDAPVTHHRQLYFVRGEYWVVVDDLLGVGEHRFDLFFHLMPELKVQVHPTSRAAHASNVQGANLYIKPVEDKHLSVRLIEGSTEPIQGWVSRYSGEKRPAPTLRYRLSGAAPARFCTLLFPQAAGAPALDLQVESLAAVTPHVRFDLPMPLALRVETGDHLDTLLLAVGSAGQRKHFGKFATEAEVAFVRQAKARGDVVTMATDNNAAISTSQPQPLKPTAGHPGTMQTSYAAQL